MLVPFNMKWIWLYILFDRKMYGIMCDESLMHRSPLDEYWSKGSTTTPTPSPNPNKYINNYYNKDNSYFDSTYNTTKNPHTFNQHYTQSTSYFYSSTTKNPYSFNNNQYSTTKNPLSFNIFASYSTTRNLYDFSNNKYTTTKNPYDFGNLNHYTTKSNANSQTPEPLKIFHNYNQYYSSSTTKNPFVGFNYYSTTAKPEHTSNSVYKLLNNNYNAFTTPSTTTTNKILPNYISSASQNSPSIINMNIEASVSNGKYVH